MKYMLLALLVLAGCSVHSKPMSASSASEFAEDVRCAIGYKGVCFCFVASVAPSEVKTSGVGMAIDHSGNLCK